MERGGGEQCSTWAAQAGERSSALLAPSRSGPAPPPPPPTPLLTLAPPPQLTSVPPELHRCTALRQLDLSNNKITKLVLDLRSLGALESLQLYGNPLEWLPDLAPARALRSLSLANVSTRHRAAAVAPGSRHRGPARLRRPRSLAPSSTGRPPLRAPPPTPHPQPPHPCPPPLPPPGAHPE
jgi:hypothetical protein